MESVHLHCKNCSYLKVSAPVHQKKPLLPLHNDRINYVGLPEDSTVFTDTFTDDDYKALVKDLYDGKIKVESDTTAEEPAAENITVNFQGNLK